MKRERGNIIMTALFVSVFLFFLSIALIWTNRQDIALSLTMEHKMKGEAAARSGAMRVYAGLRNFDLPPSLMEGKLDSGATWKAELVELPPEGDRGAMILLRCRGTSGPLSSFYTMHLLKTELGPDLSGDVGRMLGFLKMAPDNSLEVEEGAEEGTAVEAEEGAEGEDAATGKVMYGDFELKDVDIGLDGTAQKFAAFKGPLFVTAQLPPPATPLQVFSYLPVFSPVGGSPKAYGPVVLNAPAPESENGLSVMSYAGEELSWNAIPFPEEEVETPNPPPIAVLDLEAPKNATWTTLATRSVADSGNTFSWRDTEPATSDVGEAQDLGAAEFEIDVNRTIDWGSAPTTPTKRGFVLRGAIAAHGETVYSHGWEYMYKHFNGSFVAAPIPPIMGSTVTRWPCVRKYNLQEKEWSTAWSGLKDNGDVFSETVPDQDVLLVNSDGVCFSRTAGTPSRLLRLDPSGNVAIGADIPGRVLFMYQNEPHTISNDPAKPGILNLQSGKVIGFETLPTRIPEISGPVVTKIDKEEIATGLTEIETSPLGEDLEGTPEMRTIRQAYDLSYKLDPSASVATDGDNLYTKIQITTIKSDPTFELFGSFDLDGPNGSVLARYDGTRWHILPHGLLAAFTSTLAAPEGEMFCAFYNGLPKAKSRYTVVSIDVDHFEFSR